MSSALRVRVSEAELHSSRLRIEDERHHYLGRVRRVAVGNRLELFDGAGGSRDATIVEMTSEATIVEPTSPVRATDAGASPLSITSVLPLIKGDRMDFAIAKLTELGIHEIAVVRCERAVVTLEGERATKRVARFRRIAEDAARQCGRADIPAIPEIAPFEQVLASLTVASRLLFTPDATAGLAELVKGVGSSVALLTGPEGGLTSGERDVAKTHGFVESRLGPRVLRAETAPVAAASAVQALIGDLGW